MAKQIAIFIAFIIYIIGIFLITNPVILAVCLVCHILLMLILKISIQKAFYNILAFTPFILITAILNSIFMGLESAIFITIHLYFISNITYIFSQKISTYTLGLIIQRLLTPLKFLGLHVENIGIMICIAISFVPIMKQEIENIMFSLKAKGLKWNNWQMIFHISFIINPLFSSLFHKINEIELALKAKAYLG